MSDPTTTTNTEADPRAAWNEAAAESEAAQRPADPKPKYGIERLPCLLSDKEIVDVARRFADARNRIDEFDAETKALSSERRAKKAKLQAQAKELEDATRPVIFLGRIGHLIGYAGDRPPQQVSADLGVTLAPFAAVAIDVGEAVDLDVVVAPLAIAQLDLEATVDVGDIARITSEFSVDGIPTHPTTLYAEVKPPTGLVYRLDFPGTAAAKKLDVGRYRFDVPCLAVGTYKIRIVGTGDAAAASLSAWEVVNGPLGLPL